MSSTTDLSASQSSSRPADGLWGKWWMEWAAIFLFWTFMALLMVGNRLLDTRHPMGPPREVAFFVSEFYLWALLTPFVFWMSRSFSIERDNWRTRLGQHLAVAFFVAFCFDLFTDLIRIYVVRPPWLESATFHPLDDLFELDFLYEFGVYLAVLSAGFARDYFLRFKERQEQAARLEAQLAEARLQSLRMQINPHFLFNTLHAISSLVERNPKGVRRMIARLSELLRYTLEDNTEQEVPLRQELQFLEGYLDIQQIRFQDKLTVEEHIDEEVLEAMVPNLILQPLVENAIKHGASQIEGVGRIEIAARREGARLQLQVIDNGPGFSGNGATKKGVGLQNVQSRLEELYGEKQYLALHQLEEGGLAAVVSFPYHTRADLHALSVSE